MTTASPSLSDARLTRRAVRGSRRAFEAIFRRYHQDLYRYCAAIVGNPADAQDAVQNTMLKVLQALPGEERRIELKLWLYRIAHNEAIEIVRRRRPSEQIDAEALLGATDPAVEAEARDRLWRVVADVAELPERQRGALVMRELGGLEFEQIGAALGTSAATARQTLYEARQGLRAMSEGREMDCAEAMRAISDGDRRLLRGRKLRAHLRACEECRDFRAAIASRRADLALLAPLPAAAATGIAHGVLGGAAVGKSLLGATAVKTLATVGVVAAVGVTAADRGGLIDLGPGWSVAPPAAKPAPPPSQPRAGSAASRSGSPALTPADAARSAGGKAGARSAQGISQRQRADSEAASPRSKDQSPPHPAPQPGAPAAAGKGASARGVPAAAPPERADKGRHLGQLKHPEHGQAAAHAGSKGRSESAPGQNKAAQAPADPPSPPEPPPAPEMPAPAPGPPAGSAAPAKQSPAEGTAAPAAEQDAAAPPVVESPTAEPAGVSHGNSGAARSTP